MKLTADCPVCKACDKAVSSVVLPVTIKFFWSTLFKDHDYPKERPKSTSQI